MLPSEAVANYFIQKSFDTGQPLSPMKLLKLVYIAHGWHRGYFGTNLINDAVEAWQYGPVIPDLYRDIKHYGRRTIDAAIDGYLPLELYPQGALPNERTLALLDNVWRAYGDKDGLQLSALTHQPGTPWDIIWRQGGGARNAIIPNDLIEAHYREKIRHPASAA